jgi:hypothetical protein
MHHAPLRFLALIGVCVVVGGSSATAQDQLVSLRHDVTESTRSVGGLPRVEYLARARAICTAATKQLRAVERQLWGPPPYHGDPGTLKDWATWHNAAARVSKEALVKLHGLPLPPTAYRARLSTWFSLADRLPALLRRVASAASAGNAARYQELSRERVRLTHQYGELGSVRFPPLLPAECPVSLPA